MTTQPAKLEEHGQLLDKIYAVQRHFYDVTRKYFLFGRDRVLQRIAEDNPAAVLEVGCGTGRNLFVLERKLPKSHLFGLDASMEMLKQAEKIAGEQSTVQFAFGYAESFSPQELFQKSSFPFLFFSYSLSMMPNWNGALEHALSLLDENGTIWIVDFWDQQGYPQWFQKTLQWWLALFHVKFEPRLLELIESLPERTSNGERLYSVEIESVGRRYAYLAKITHRND